MSKSAKQILFGTLAVLSILNFVAFLIISFQLGGSASNGHIAAGHYFLGEHGVYTEVSRSVFEYSKWHTRSLLLSHPLGALSAWLYARGRASTAAA